MTTRCSDKDAFASFAGEFRTTAQQYVKDLFLKYYDLSINDVDMRILQANRSTRDKQKFSLVYPRPITLLFREMI